MWDYLATLSDLGQAVFWGQEDQKFFIERDLQYLLHRRVELSGIVTRLLRDAKIEAAEAVYSSWANRYRIDGVTAAQLVETGGDAYQLLTSRLSKLQSMVSGYLPKVVDDLCGLPLDAIRQRNIDLITADHAKKVAALEKAKAERIDWILSQAREILEDEAPPGWSNGSRIRKPAFSSSRVRATRACDAFNTSSIGMGKRVVRGSRRRVNSQTYGVGWRAPRGLRSRSISSPSCF